MSRLTCVIIALAALASVAGAQQPLAPGVVPATPNSPGIQIPVRTQPQPSPQSGIVYFPVPVPGGWTIGWGYQSYNPWNNYGNVYEGTLPSARALAATAVTVEPAQRPDPVVVLAQEFPATLSLQFPAAAEVWLDGKKVTERAKEERVLTSPVLKPDQSYTFLVKARWEQNGKTYEAKRAVTLGPGDRSRLLIVSGDEAREQAPPPRAVSR